MARILTVVAMVLTLCASAPSAGAPQATERFVYVTVLDKDGLPVTGLTADHFAVREGGQDRAVVRLEPLTIPMHVALLVDTSGHGGIQNDAFRKAVGTFAAQLASAHHVALYTFGDRPALIERFTQDGARLQAAIPGMFVTPHDRSQLIDGVERALRDFSGVEARRPVIVVIASETPEVSGRTSGGVIRRLVDQSVALHVVSVARAPGTSIASRVNPDIPSSSRALGSMAAAGEGDRERTQMIEQGTAVTGGSRQRIASSLALGPALNRIAAEVSRSYLVTFSRPGGGRVKDLQVGVFVDGVTVRATAAPYGTR